MRSFFSWKLAGLIGLASFGSLTLVDPEPLSANDPILEIHADSLTDYKPSSASAVQDILPHHRHRGVRLEGSMQEGTPFGMAIAGNPSERAWSGTMKLNGVRLDAGNLSTGEVDMAFHAEGPMWPIGRSFNSRQETSGGSHRDSDGPQGKNWFQNSQPEIVLYKVNGEMGADDDNDILVLIYRADAYAEFKRVDIETGTSDTFKATNGAAGIFLYAAGSGSEPDTYTLTDQHGIEFTFFGFDSDSDPAKGQLWKIEDNAGNVAYVGHETTGSTAISSGFDSGGRISTAYDANGRRFSYTYTTLDSIERLTRVKAEINASGWVTVAQVDYEYYTNETYGDIGDLKLVEITEPLTDTGVSLTRKKYYRYWEGTFDNATNPGYSHAIQYVIDYEGARKFDWSDTTFDEDFLTATENSLKPYASVYLEYDSSHRVDKAWFNGECGCSGASNGEYEIAYGTNGSYTDNSGYDTAWMSRAVVERPDGTYMTQYFDEVHQPLGRVITDADPSTGTPETWAAQAVRGSDGLVTDVHTPANVSSYTHATGAFSLSSSAGLVTSLTRETTGATDGYVTDQKHKEGTSGTAYFDGSWTWSKESLTVGDSSAIRPYMTQSRAYTEEISSGTTGAVDTGYAYTFYGGKLAVEKVVRTDPIPSASKNGSAAGAVTETHYRTDGRADFVISPRDRVPLNETLTTPH